MICLLLAVGTLAVYNPVNRHPFVNYDDDRYVTENAHVRNGLTWETVNWALTSTEQANWHPLTWMSHALDFSLFRVNPAGHHFTSVLLHAMNAMLLFLLLALATRRIGPSLLVAALFAVHPINVESVAWIAERKNVLSTTFFLLTLGAYGWYARRPDWQRYLAVFGLFACGLASKPMVITLPFVLLLLDYWPLRRAGAVAERNASPSVPAGARTNKFSRLVAEKIPLLALSFLSAVITMKAQEAGGALRSALQVSYATRLGTAIYAYGMYLWKMAWPARLAPLYPHPGDSLAAWRVGLASLVLIGVTLGVLKLRAKRYLLVGWLWFLGMLVPVIGLVQIGDAAMADRYAYLPLIGIFVMIAFGVAELARTKKRGAAWLALPAVAWLLALGVLTERQINYWRSSEELWSHTLAVTENNFIAEDNLGGALVLLGREEEAYPHFEEAARINPKDAMSRSNLGTYHQMHARMPEAIADYEAAISLTSDKGLLANAYANLGAAQRTMGENEEARQSFEQALHFNSNQFNAWLGLGSMALQRGKIEEAITDLSRAVELRPTGEGYVRLGRALQQATRPAEAKAAYEAALRLQPDMAEAQKALEAMRIGGK